MIYKNYEELIKEHPIPIYSDLREFVKLYARLGFECKIRYINSGEEHGLFRIILCNKLFSKIEEEGTQVDNTYFGEGRYSHTKVLFNKNGEFICQGFWE